VIAVGRVTQRKGAKLHAATCRIVRHRQLIPATIRALRTEDAPLVCKHCQPILLAAAKDAEMDANQRAGNSTTWNGRVHAKAAEALVLALETPAGRLARSQRTDEMRAMFDAIVAANFADLAPAA